MKVISKIILIIELIFMIWLTFSWSEICCKNLSEKPKYSKINIFRVVGLMKER